MNTRTYLAPMALSLGLLFSSCPGDDAEAAPAAASDSASDSASLEEQTEAFDATVDQVAGEIDAAAKAASETINDENAAAILEELSKSIEGGN